MKKILSIMALAASMSLGYSQGTVVFGSLSAVNNISTNTAALGSGLSGTVGKTSTAANGYYYALLTQTYPGTGTATGYGSSAAAWTFSGAYSTNSSLSAGGTTGGTAAISGWTPGTTEYVEVVGWSSNLGSDYATVLAEYQSGQWVGSGYFGYSAAGSVTSGGVGTPPSNGNPLFGGTGISGFDLYAVGGTVVPEPTTIALIGLGGLGLAMIRRRK